jgi:hypothetical protein
MAARPITDDPHYTLRGDRGNPVGYGRNQGIGVLDMSRSRPRGHFYAGC